MINDPATRVQDYLAFGEFGEVNPSISDGSTFTFLSVDKMKEIFDHEIEGCFLYSRHLNPSNDYLARALALMEGSEAAQVTGSGMAAISCAIMQICGAGDEIISSRTIYGGTYAIMKNFFPKYNLNTHFVDITNLEQVKSKINKNTKIIYCETVSNPLLEVADIKALSEIAKQHNIKLVVDNTFTPMIISPLKLGADIVVYSMTKYINGASDTCAGAICASKEFIDSLKSVNDGAAMLLGPTMDSLRSASVLKNLHTLHVRMVQHSKNADYVAKELHKTGVKVFYPGLEFHPQHNIFKSMMNSGYGFSGMITLDVKTEEAASALMTKMQNESIGYFAVSLGFYKTLFSSPGSSTSSEIPKEEQDKMGLTPGLVRLSIGLDQDIERTVGKMIQCMKDVNIL